MSVEIAVVIVNWNKRDDVVELLGELCRLDEPFDVFVVDNGSSDDSVAAIRANFPSVKLVQNEVNLGGTGGFNTGLARVCEENRYAYVWLLDNDARIERRTLSELLEPMRSDPKVGIVGSRIVDTEKRDITVETGGRIRWDMMTVEPLNRNTTAAVPALIDVDYVAICSALVRVAAVRQVGLMDERFFILWDDMDWGLCFKECGYRVVCATRSVVYHGSFTERDRGVASVYFSVRNSLLVYSKHTPAGRRALLFYRSVRHLMRNCILLMVQGIKHKPRAMIKAIVDFVSNRWGNAAGAGIAPDLESGTPAARQSIRTPPDAEKLLVSVVDSSAEQSRLLLDLAAGRFPKAQITVLVHDDRVEYFRRYPVVLIDKRQTVSPRYIWSRLRSIRRRGFDAVIAAKPYPFIYAVKTILLVNRDGEIVSEKRTGLDHFLWMGLAMLMGEVTAHLLMPVLMIKSIQYSRRSHPASGAGRRCLQAVSERKVTS